VSLRRRYGLWRGLKWIVMPLELSLSNGEAWMEIMRAMMSLSNFHLQMETNFFRPASAGTNEFIRLLLLGISNNI
jgi:hypothetical protein